MPRSTIPRDQLLGPVPEANQPGHRPAVEQDKPLLSRRGGPERFEFRFEALLRPFAALATVLPGSAYVELDDDVTIRFGVWQMAFPRDLVVSVRKSGGYWLPKVAGPPHVSFVDCGITFATNRQRGLCIGLAEPQPGPYPLLRHPSVTVTVADPTALATALGL